MTIIFQVDTVFSDKNVKKLLLVVHPHMKHFTGEYNFYFGDFLKEILQENIFVPGDAASHLNLPSRVIFIRKAFDKL